jgi:hypothetical protein
MIDVMTILNRELVSNGNEAFVSFTRAEQFNGRIPERPFVFSRIEPPAGTTREGTIGTEAAR